MLPKFKKHYERKALPNGKPNPKYIDHLDEDKKIRDQDFACLSFISPEKIIKQKNEFLFEEFVRQWDFNTSMKKFVDFLDFLAAKFDLKFEDLTEDLKAFVEDKKSELSFTVAGDFKTFIEKNEEALEKKFMAEHAFATCVRGIKVRGVYPTQEEAEMRCRFLREKDPAHDIFVGPVGVWIPFDPDAYKTGRVEFMEEELNQLMSEKIKNEQRAKDEFDDRIRESKQKAMEENREMAKKTGNVLTQTVTEEGDLEALENVVDAMGKEHDMRKAAIAGKDATAVMPSDELAQRIFDDPNVVTSSHTDHGQSRLITGPFAPKRADDSAAANTATPDDAAAS